MSTNPITLDFSLAEDEAIAVIKAVQIGKTKVGAMIRRTQPGKKLDALRSEYQALANAEIEFSETMDKALLGG